MIPPAVATHCDPYPQAPCVQQLERLKARLVAREEDQDMPGLLDAGIDNLLKLDYIYQDGEIEKKREVIGSMYPEKLTFDGERLRTTRINEAARIIYTLDKAFSENEKGQSGNIPALSSQVGKTGRTRVRYLIIYH
jgi:site-specific DNA recombinase